MDVEERASGTSDFGALLRRHRLAAGLSQEILAERARMSSDGISALERGYRRSPQRETVTLLADALALTEEQRVLFATSARSSGGHRVRSFAASGLGVKAGETLTTNLPYQITPLIGRDDVLAETETLVRERSLVSLVGAGGVGKTRLALQIGTDLLAGWSDGVWLVELAPLSEASQVANALGSTFGLREQGDRPMLDVLVQYLRLRRLLLILDNCEHVVDEVARVAETILRAAPHVRILSTSREPLRIDGEHVYRVPSLSLPSSDSLTVEEAIGYGAVALFAERARASDAAFTLTDEDVPIVVGICRRLDGIALAIELAAARVSVLHLHGLASKLDDRFRVLTGGRRTALPRHQTMRALIDWSHDLLSESEQRLFRRLAIFVGGWTPEAAEAVCTYDGLDASKVVELLSSLVDKSLVVAEATGHPRYQLLESTRAFALEKLDDSGERDALPFRHAQWLADLGDRSYEASWTLPTLQWNTEYRPEFENARSATDWALANDQPMLAARIVVGFSKCYQGLGMIAELGSRLEAVLGRLDADGHPALAARAWNELSWTLTGSSRIEATSLAVELGERCCDPAVTVPSLSDLAYQLMKGGRVEEAQAAIDRALHLTKQDSLTRTSIHADALDAAGAIAQSLGRFDEAQRLYAEALALAKTLGNDTIAIAVRHNMAELEFALGNTARALELASGITAEMLGLSYGVVTASLIDSAAYRTVLGDIAGARIAAREALRLVRGVVTLGMPIAIQRLATVAALSGDARHGARLCGFVDAWYLNEGEERDFTEQRMYDIVTAALREKLSDEEIETLAAEGAQLSEDQAVAEALAI